MIYDRDNDSDDGSHIMTVISKNMPWHLREYPLKRAGFRAAIDDSHDNDDSNVRRERGEKKRKKILTGTRA